MSAGRNDSRLRSATLSESASQQRSGLRWCRDMTAEALVDALSEILKSLKMRHAAAGTMQLSAPWGLRVADFEAPTAHVLVDGPAWWLRLPGREPVLFEQGDIALFAGANQYCMSSAPDTPCEDMAVAWRANGLVYPEVEPASPVKFRWGGGGAVTRLLGFAFGLAGEQRNPLRDALPEVIILRRADGGAFPWIRPAIDFLSAPDASSPGFQATSRLLAELVFVSIVRSHLLAEPHTTRGWLRGLTDPCIARALQAIHARPGADWTVGSLAQTAGLSRTKFATRFAELVEVAPIEYLTRWRMHLAAERIVTSHPNLTRLAFELGYASDAAFRDAFKRRYGVSPSRFAGKSEPPEPQTGIVS